MQYFPSVSPWLIYNITNEASQKIFSLHLQNFRPMIFPNEVCLYSTGTSSLLRFMLSFSLRRQHPNHLSSLTTSCTYVAILTRVQTLRAAAATLAVQHGRICNATMRDTNPISAAFNDCQPFSQHGLFSRPWFISGTARALRGRKHRAAVKIESFMIIFYYLRELRCV